jgi:phosphohistidine phosphatase
LRVADSLRRTTTRLSRARDPEVAEGVDRKVVLLRHAKSAWPDVPDHDRPLAPRGRRDAPVMGRWLRAAGCLPDQVVCSTARRARETWQLAQAGLGAAPPVSFDSRVYQASAMQLLDLVRGTPPAARTLLIVGHDPAVPELALALAASQPANAGALRDAEPPGVFDRMRVKFPTAAVAVLEFTGCWDKLVPGSARLTRFVIPRDLGTSAGGAAIRRDPGTGRQ